MQRNDQKYRYNHVILLILFTALVLLAGCTFFADQNQQGRITKLEVSNFDEVNHSVDVVVLQDGSVVYWTTRRVKRVVGGVASQPARISSPKVINRSAEFTVLVRVNGSNNSIFNRSRVTRWTYSPEEFWECTIVTITVEDQGRPGIHVGWDRSRDAVNRYNCPEPD